MVYINNSDELYHYGVKGMRWGHRKASYQNTATSGNSVARQKYLDAKANKKAANRTYVKAYNKAYNRNFAMLSPFKKHRQANDERWNDAAEKGMKSYEADQAYKKAKKEYKQTDEYKAKRAKAIKVGAAAAGTALAVYGAYKVSKAVKNNIYKHDMDRGMKVAKALFDAGYSDRAFETISDSTSRYGESLGTALKRTVANNSVNGKVDWRNVSKIVTGKG